MSRGSKPHSRRNDTVRWTAFKLIFALAAALVLMPYNSLALARKEVGTMKAPHTLSLAFDKITWNFTSRGKYLLVEDPRGLYQIFHPWDVSKDGDFGAISTKVTVPAGWHGPVFLNLYANDTYVAEGWEQARPNWTHTYASCHNLVGHRFKEVLIDGQVAWDQDVSDDESFGYTSIDITKFVKPGKLFELTLRVIDKISPATKLPGDEFHLGIWSWDGLADKDACKKFYTRVFFGDVALSNGVPVEWEENPARRETQFKPIKLAVAQPVARAQGSFNLSAPNGLPEDSYPVTWGIPFAQGRLFDKANVTLTDTADKPVPLQTQILHKWPDGSIHWLLLDFQADSAGANKQYTVIYGTEVEAAPAQAGLSVTEADGAVSVNTGALTFSVKKGARDLADTITLAGEAQPLGERLTGMVQTRDGWVETTFVPTIENVTVEASGPERATVLAAGKLTTDDKTFGRFTCRIHAYRGKPYLRVLFRIFNDTDVPAQLVCGFALSVQTPLVEGEVVLGDQKLQTGPAETQRLLVRQSKCDVFEVFDGSDARRATGKQWVGPISLQTPEHGVSGEVRHFAPLYPKRMWAGGGGQVVFDLFTNTIEYEQYVMTKGEAKRHEVLLYFHKGTSDQPNIQAAFKAFEAPPLLLSAEWYADNQAFGRGAPLTQEKFPELYKWMVESKKPSLECNQPLGIRNWPDTYSDSIYSAYRWTWQNMYQEMDYGAYIVGLLAGRRELLDYVRAYQEHFMDIDICHHHSDPVWIGASYGISPYHTGHEPYALNAPLGGLFLLHYLTGDPDARESAVGIADWVNATSQGLGADSARAVGWPLRSAMIAYENTGDNKHLETAKRLVEYALAAAAPRRGFFSEPPATWQYRGGNSVMNSILMAGLMHYWRASDDERVGQLCANLAYEMAYSWMSPIEPGLILGGDPLQQVNICGYAMQNVAPLFWGYELTGDKIFLEKGARMMKTSILDEKYKGAAFRLSRYWEMQDILYYYGLAKALAQ